AWQRAVGHHALERRPGAGARPAGDPQSNQSNARKAAHDNAGTDDFCAKQQLDDDWRISEQNHTRASFRQCREYEDLVHLGPPRFNLIAWPAIPSCFWLYISCFILLSTFCITLLPSSSINFRRFSSRISLNFCCCEGFRMGAILSSTALPICLNCSTFCTGLRAVFFFSAASCGSSCFRKGTICCFCCSVSPSSIENWLIIASSGLMT